ncbi:hypothetical protein RFI_28327 [Reticulomyxa filosa]|uniref:Uncharacterized protein n=1 Tax=Reticulomyxa filosa TaxID=46433 RepID=X6M6H3_RETFI|nr:hypothetical protein RFI_28327 [Reticulomyxa filosa]|eukprot:ETO09062.1 hypothetical protein RFI_28327 [Reticulomyxa filosa]
MDKSQNDIIDTQFQKKCSKWKLNKTDYNDILHAKMSEPDVNIFSGRIFFSYYKRYKVAIKELHFDSAQQNEIVNIKKEVNTYFNHKTISRNYYYKEIVLPNTLYLIILMCIFCNIDFVFLDNVINFFGYYQSDEIFASVFQFAENRDLLEVLNGKHKMKQKWVRHCVKELKEIFSNEAKSTSLLKVFHFMIILML